MVAGTEFVSQTIDEPRILAVTGVDGSGKTTLTNWLQEELRARGHEPGFVWSRFNNYASLPFLAATRLSGHNYYRVHSGVRMGFHDFDRLLLMLRYLFVGLQAIDVNIANQSKIIRPSRHAPVTICERGPWDTLVDVAADTALDELAGPFMLKLFCGQVVKRTDIVLIDRDADLIEASRPELKYDNKLRDRQRLYRKLAAIGRWSVLDNSGSINDTKKMLSEWLTASGY